MKSNKKNADAGTVNVVVKPNNTIHYVVIAVAFSIGLGIGISIGKKSKKA